MATLKVKYSIIVEQTVDWPDDEMHHLTYNNLQANLDLEDLDTYENGEIIAVAKDGKEFNFE